MNITFTSPDMPPLTFASADETHEPSVPNKPPYDQDALYDAIRAGRSLTPEILLAAGVPLRPTADGPVIVGDLFLEGSTEPLVIRGPLFTGVSGITGKLVLSAQGDSLGSLRSAGEISHSHFTDVTEVAVFRDLGELRTVGKLDVSGIEIQFAPKLEEIGELIMCWAKVVEFARLRRVSGLMSLDNAHIGSLPCLKEIGALEMTDSYANFSHLESIKGPIGVLRLAEFPRRVAMLDAAGFDYRVTFPALRRVGGHLDLRQCVGSGSRFPALERVGGTLLLGCEDDRTRGHDDPTQPFDLPRLTEIGGHLISHTRHLPLGLVEVGGSIRLLLSEQNRHRMANPGARGRGGVFDEHGRRKIRTVIPLPKSIGRNLVIIHTGVTEETPSVYLISAAEQARNRCLSSALKSMAPMRTIFDLDDEADPEPTPVVLLTGELHLTGVRIADYGPLKHQSLSTITRYRWQI